MSRAYGTWPSPFRAEEVAASSPRIDGARFVGEEIWWGESVPTEAGRVTVRTSTGREVLTAPWSARSRVHEYGGGAWTADAGGALYFVEAKDQRVYRVSPGADPVPLTVAGPSHGGLRLQHGRLLAVREDLSVTPHRRAVIEIPTDGSAAADDEATGVFVQGSAFFAHPALSPDGTRVAWVEWSGIRMPWEAAHLSIASIEDQRFAEVTARAALQPEWVSDTELLYADDPTGRWGLFRQSLDGVAPQGEAQAVAPADADTGYGLWVLGNRWYQPLADGRIVAVRTNGRDEVVVIGSDGGARALPLPCDGHVSIDDVADSLVLISGNGSAAAPGLWCVDVDSGETVAVRGGARVDPLWMPPARPMVIDGDHGPVHAFAYAPANPEVTAAADELPPYVVFVHGGPTAHVTGAASSAIAFYTSRGIGVLDVNYGGSTGYGREYRERLHRGWGVVDVDDVIAAARGLADAGLADPARIAIRGSSAGGWTVLSSLVRGGTFAAGISRYGVADLRMLAADSPDFEKHYLEGLVGPLPASEQLFIDRSPLTHAERIDVPVLILQGEEDRVVPPTQSAAIRDALAARGIPHEYVLYPGEGHGFRRAETVVDALERELTFLGRAFGFEPALD